MISPGEFTEILSLLILQENDSVYSWTESLQIWGKAEPQVAKNLFSTVGLGVKSVKFTVWKQNLTLHNALKWQGKHCFITDINEVDRLYYEVTAALVEPKICILLRSKETKDSLNRPVRTPPNPVFTFPGCMVEKYMGFTRLDPQSQVSEQYVLITPKSIELKTADLVKIGKTIYNIQLFHTLDEYKNEYEITVKKDV